MGKYKIGYNPKTKKTDREHRLKFLSKGVNIKGKDIHHKDGDKDNNSPSNLKPMSHSKHTAITNTETHTKNIKCQKKGCSNKHYANSMCKVCYNKKARHMKAMKKRLRMAA